MAIPKNPEILIVKNNFYPDGLNEGHIWNYYQKYKGVILNNTRGRDLMIALMVYLNKPVIVRKGINTDFIQLSNTNYDKVISGRTISIYSTMKAYEDFCVIDIDTDEWDKAKDATFILYHILKKANFIINLKILYIGKNSFHIHCKFVNKLPISKIKSIISEYIRQNINPNIFTLLHKRDPKIPNIDLSPNKFRGAYITEGSLSIWGLRCIEVPIKELKIFKQWKAKII